MIARSLLFAILFLVVTFTGTCQKKKETVDEDLLSFLIAQPSSLQSSCQRFLLSEGNCVASTDNTLVACNSAISAIRGRILPADKSNDSVIELYFNCFTNVNLVYNGLISCNKSSFATNAEYRRNQRLGTGSQINANTQWRSQFNNCASIDNGIPPADSGLREVGTRLSSDPFQ